MDDANTSQLNILISFVYKLKTGYYNKYYINIPKDLTQICMCVCVCVSSYQNAYYCLYSN